MHKLWGFEASAVGPVRNNLKNLNGSSAYGPVIGHDANWPGLHIVWSFSCTLKFVQVFPSNEPWKATSDNDNGQLLAGIRPSLIYRIGTLFTEFQGVRISWKSRMTQLLPENSSI